MGQHGTNRIRTSVWSRSGSGCGGRRRSQIDLPWGAGLAEQQASLSSFTCSPGGTDHGELGVIKRPGSGAGQTEADRAGRDELGNFWNALKRRWMEGSSSPTIGRKRGPTACQEGRGAKMTTCPWPVRDVPLGP